MSLLELSSFKKNNDLKATILAEVEHANPAGNESVDASIADLRVYAQRAIELGAGIVVEF